MTYEVYTYIFLGGAILAAVMLVISIILFFVLKIPTVIGDLTGANARKAIENIRNHNENTGQKVYRISTVNRGQGPVTDKIDTSDAHDEKETTLLSGELYVPPETTTLSQSTEKNLFTVEYEITFVHTDEVIELKNQTAVSQ